MFRYWSSVEVSILPQNPITLILVANLTGLTGGFIKLREIIAQSVEIHYLKAAVLLLNAIKSVLLYGSD